MRGLQTPTHAPASSPDYATSSSLTGGVHSLLESVEGACRATKRAESAESALTGTGSGTHSMHERGLRGVHAHRVVEGVAPVRVPLDLFWVAQTLAGRDRPRPAIQSFPGTKKPLH